MLAGAVYQIISNINEYINTYRYFILINTLTLPIFDFQNKDYGFGFSEFCLSAVCVFEYSALSKVYCLKSPNEE